MVKELEDMGWEKEEMMKRNLADTNDT